MANEALTNICAPFLVQTPERTILLLLPVGPEGEASSHVAESIAENLLANPAKPDWVSVGVISVGDFDVADHTIVTKNSRPEISRDIAPDPRIASAWQVTLPATDLIPAGRRIMLWHREATLDDVREFMRMHNELSEEQVRAIQPVQLRMNEELGTCYVRAMHQFSMPSASMIRFREDTHSSAS